MLANSSTASGAPFLRRRSCDLLCRTPKKAGSQLIEMKGIAMGLGKIIRNALPTLTAADTRTSAGEASKAGARSAAARAPADGVAGALEGRRKDRGAQTSKISSSEHSIPRRRMDFGALRRVFGGGMKEVPLGGQVMTRE